MKKEHYGEGPGQFNEKKDCYCQFCGKLCHSKNSLKNHERRCKQNPDRLETHITGDHFKAWRDIHKAWNYGLTKETDERVAKGAETYNKNHKLGLHNKHSGKAKTEEAELERRRKISEGQKKAHAEGRANEIYQNKNSYPERWLENVLKNNFNMEKDIHYIREAPISYL